jgi:prophage antirepressor-like protein
MSQLEILNINSIEKIFGNHTVRIFYDNANNVWFVGADICKILDYDNKDGAKAIRKMIDDEDKITFHKFKDKVEDFATLPKLHPDTILINESGFYCLAIKSRKEIAKNFRRWVTSEVLPSIRKTGQYKIGQSQKVIELDYLKESNKSIELNNKAIELNNDKLKLEIEMKKLTLIDNSEFTNDAHYNVLARELIQGNDNVPDYFELISILEYLKDEFQLKSKDIISLRGFIGKAVKKWFKENKSGGQSPRKHNKYVNSGAHAVCFYPFEYKEEIINEIKKILNEKKKIIKFKLKIDFKNYISINQY